MEAAFQNHTAVECSDVAFVLVTAFGYFVKVANQVNGFGFFTKCSALEAFNRAQECALAGFIRGFAD